MPSVVNAAPAQCGFPRIGKWKREFFQGLEKVVVSFSKAWKLCFFLAFLAAWRCPFPVFFMRPAKEFLNRQGAKSARGRRKGNGQKPHAEREDYFESTTNHTDRMVAVLRGSSLRKSVSSVNSVDDLLCSVWPLPRHPDFHKIMCTESW